LHLSIRITKVHDGGEQAVLTVPTAGAGGSVGIGIAPVYLVAIHIIGVVDGGGPVEFEPDVLVQRGATEWAGGSGAGIRPVTGEVGEGDKTRIGAVSGGLLAVAHKVVSVAKILGCGGGIGADDLAEGVVSPRGGASTGGSGERAAGGGDAGALGQVIHALIRCDRKKSKAQHLIR
jgi:hypothetical protein